MKTSMTHIVSTGLRVLEWSDHSSLLRAPIRKDIKIPMLRIVRAPRNDLFEYTIAAKSGTGFWEAIVFAGVGLSAAAAVAMAFLGI